MAAEVVPFTSAYARAWDEFIGRSDQATFCHHRCWSEAVEETYGHRSRSLLALDPDGQITGVLPLFLVDRSILGRSLVSVPFAPYGGPCAADASVRNALLQEAAGLADSLQTRSLEVRTLTGGAPPGFSEMTDYSTFLMDLTGGTETIWDGMSRKVRNRIRNAGRHGLTFRMDRDLAAVRDFYGIYLRNQRDLGTPAHGAGFFGCIFRLFPGKVSIARVFQGDRVVASLFILGFREMLTVSWGASLGESQKHSPNNLAYWETLRYAAAEGYRFLDFGRSLKGSGNYRFKQHWNGTEVPLHYLFYPGPAREKPLPERYRGLGRIWRRLPLAATRVLGPRIRKYFV